MANEQSSSITRSLKVGGLTIGGTTNTVLSDAVVTLQKTVPASSTNAEFDIAVTIANVLAMAIETSVDATVKTNSSGSPSETLTLKAGQPLIWNSASDPAGAKYMGTDLTKIYVTCTLACLIKVGFCIDSSPVLSP